jgi:hypothetical protein
MRREDEETITPEPTPEERTAILAALDRLAENGVPAAYRSAWREEGIRENSGEDCGPAATGPPAGP